MGDRDICFAAPQGMMYVTVAYDEEQSSWHGGFTLKRVDREGEYTLLGSATIEFGPFDSYIEVGHWLASLTRQLRTLAVKKLPTLPD